MRSQYIWIVIFILILGFAIKSMLGGIFDSKFSQSGDATGIIVNHHLLAPGLIDRSLSKISPGAENIVLISPDHFGLNYRTIATPNLDVAKLLNVKYDSRLASMEHGINNILPYLDKYASGANILPLVVGEGIHEKDVENIVNRLSVFKNTTFVLSSDMSHYLDYRSAYFHDKHTQDMISNLDEDAVSRAETDSKMGLVIFLKIMQNIGAYDFHLIERTDSASIVSRPTTGENTSYITGYFSKAANKKNDNDRPVDIFACGDMMFDRDVRIAIDKYGFENIFKKYSRLFDGSDISLVNLEGPITSFKSEATESNLKFTFDVSVAQKLKKLGVNMVSLANNHTFNFGSIGLDETRRTLSSAGMDFFGDPDNSRDNILFRVIKNKKIAFVGYHQFSYKSLKKTLDIVRGTVNQADIIIVMAHWGNEYDLTPSARQRDEARQFIDAGADIIIGSHPHVIQPIEIYKDRPIFYSLGNCMFDQYFSVKTRQGLAIGLSVSKNKIDIVLMPIINTPTNFGLLNYAESANIINNIASMSFVDFSIKNDMYDGIFTLPFKTP